MTLYQAFLLVVAFLALVVAPIAAVWTIVHQLNTPPSKRPERSHASAGFSAALAELDRLVARPSVEHTVEAEQPVVKREDDDGE